MQVALHKMGFSSVEYLNDLAPPSDGRTSFRPRRQRRSDRLEEPDHYWR
jgi:hypothetical protein